MKKIIFAFAATLVMATPVFAAIDVNDQSEGQLRAQAGVLDAQADVKADAGAVAKDNTAIAKHQTKLQQHQVSHDANKTAGNDMAAAGDSVKAAGSHVAIKAKQTEKGVDQKIMQHDQSNAADAMNKKENADAQAGAAATTSDAD